MSSSTVVLLHGLAASPASTWQEAGWLDLLADSGREVIPIDLLGHGTADKPHDPAAYEQMEALVAAQLPDQPVDAIGFSLGARVLVTIATEEPERFGRLVLTGVGANLLRTEGSDVILRAIEGEGDATNPVVQYFAGLAQQPGVDRKALAACMRCPRPRLTPEILAKVMNRFPANRKALDLPPWNDPAKAIFKEAEAGGRSVPAVAGWFQMQEATIVELQKILVGQSTPQQAADAAAEAINRIIAENS